MDQLVVGGDGSIADVLLLSSKDEADVGRRKLGIVNLVARQIEAVYVPDNVGVVGAVNEGTGLWHHQTDEEFIGKRRRLALGKYGNQFITAVQAPR